jgi:hypothetical protein
MEIHSYQGSLRLALEFHSHGGRSQLWNPRAGTNGQWRRVHPPLPCGQAIPVRLRYLCAFRIIPVCPLFPIARTGMRMAEIQRTIDDFLIRYKKTPSALIAGSLGAA